VETLWVTDATLPLLRIKPALGRLFTKEDDLPNGPNVVLISHRYWQRAFGASPSAIGQKPDGQRHATRSHRRAAENFKFLHRQSSRHHPVEDRSQERSTPRASTTRAVARLKPGVTIQQANADVERLLPSLTERFPLPQGFTQKMFDDARFGSLVRPLDVDVVGDIGNMLWILLGTVGLVLLVACANVANLFLVRAEARQQELGDQAGARRRSAPGRLADDVGIAAGRDGRRRARHRARLRRDPVARCNLHPAPLPRLNEITIVSIVLVSRSRSRSPPGLLFGRHPNREVRAAAHGRGVEGQAREDSSEGRVAASRPQHAGGRAGRAQLPCC
jgi:hypothetical protein